MTASAPPVLVFMGIPPTVAVASQASHVVAYSTSGVIRYSGQGAVDYRIGGVMAAGHAENANSWRNHRHLLWAVIRFPSNKNYLMFPRKGNS